MELQCFNPSTGLSVFQTWNHTARHGATVFQSLDWVERLSDRRVARAGRRHTEFQSLDWVERLSDVVAHRQGGDAAARFNPSTGLSVFQTAQRLRHHSANRSFNPSTGLSVFQTQPVVFDVHPEDLFQSLDWVERLSDS